MSARGIAWGLLLWLAACGRPAPAADPEAPPQAPAPAASEAAAQTTTAPAAEDTAADGYEASPSRRGPEGQEIFGGDIDWSAPEVSLASMLAEPDRFAGRKVRTRGVIGRVCQRQGCWMELRGEGAEEPVRAPLAGHSYFMPQRAIGREATVVGTVDVRELSEAHKAHLRSEGAEATEVRLSVVASAVALLDVVAKGE
ncbi:MAG: DUF4920 domain-containing protein [Myxococcales bacterium]|nr:DUF4920 domain-containing protein [Myxococcales bacterium]